MKKLLTLLLFVPLFSFSQEYSEIIDVPGKTASQLYSSAKEWFTITFPSGKQVIDLDDSANGKIIGKGNFNVSAKYKLPSIEQRILWDVDFTLEILVKENKYRYKILDVSITNHLMNEGYITDHHGLIEGVYSDESKFPKTPAVSFAGYFNSKEVFKNGSDPEWLMKDMEQRGTKIKKNYVKLASGMNEAIYSNICTTDEQIKTLLESLKLKLVKVEEKW